MMLKKGLLIMTIALMLTGCGSQTPVEKAFNDAAGLNKEQTAQAVQVLDSVGVADVNEVKRDVAPAGQRRFSVNTPKYSDILVDFDGDNHISKITTSEGAVLYDANGDKRPNKLDQVYLTKDEFNKFVEKTVALGTAQAKFPNSVEPDYGPSLKVARANDKVAVVMEITGVNSLGIPVRAKLSALYSYPNGEVQEFNIEE